MSHYTGKAVNYMPELNAQLFPLAVRWQLELLCASH